jgi:hypothetical protein
LLQLFIVSTNRAIKGDFFYFAKKLELNKQLVYIFFDEYYIAVIDMLYRAKLQELWQLWYLDYWFICLIAIFLTVLELVFRANLLLKHTQIY